MNVALWWIRRDLRLSDNQALHTALQNADQVVPIFILDPKLWASSYVGEKRLAFMLNGLRVLDEDLRSRGSALKIRRGAPVAALSALMRETKATAIYAEADVSPYARRRDREVAKVLPLKRVGGLSVHPPEAVHKKDGDPYTVYTPFSRTWKALPLPQVEEVLPAPTRITTPRIPSMNIPTHPQLPNSVPFVAGEAEAQQRLETFIDTLIAGYAEDRNRMDLDGTARLSPYLRFGMLSARQAVVSALAAMDAAQHNETAYKGAQTWLNELIWREFYISILYHFPNVRQESFRENLRTLQWENDEQAFNAWKQGRTGYPVVDAAMRQLSATGWMHNRARMIVASFLTKDLLIDWRWGEKHFMRHLIDGDPAANNGGWQWTAGTGTDAAPYFRIFNPVLQGEKHDPDGAYVRRWVPELAEVPRKYIHQPWKLPETLQTSAKCIIGKTYPAPIVDHRWARQRTLAAYKRAR